MMTSMILAEEIVAPGGPSAPAWAFFTAITLGLIGVLGQQLAARKEAKATREVAEKAVTNTYSVSNGFTSRIDGKLDNLQQDLYKMMEWQRDHQEWHMTNERNHHE